MQKYFIKTFGCQMNESDSERVAALLENCGMHEVSEIEVADLAIFTTCGVRQTAEDRAYGQIHNLRKKNPDTIIVVTGCLAHRKDVRRRLAGKVDYFIPIKDISQLISTLGLSKKLIDKKITEKNCYLEIEPHYKQHESVFVPIMTGCNNFCTYCVVPYARGREWSRSVDEIFKEIDSLSRNGCKEITLLGQNVNSYAFIPSECKQTIELENNALNKLPLVDFPILLNSLAEKFPAITFRFLTSHPKDFSDELIETIAKNSNIPKEIHLPIQSGSNKILKAMNRKYTREHYLEIIEKIKKRIPGVLLSTDVIIGFPGETFKDFEKTMDIFRLVGFYAAFTNKYSSRPGTVAEKFEDSVPWEEKKRRERLLRELLIDGKFKQVFNKNKK